MANAWALVAGNAASGDHATFNGVVIPADTDFTLELDVFFDPTQNWRPIGRLGSYVSRVFKLGNSNDISISSDTGLKIITADGVNYSDRNLYRFERRGGVISLIINGVLQSGTVSDSGVFDFTTFFTQNNVGQSRGASTFYECKIFDVTDTLIHNWKNTTGTSETVWADIVGNNDATLINFPTDGTQWVLYDDGGGGTITVTGATTNYTYNAITATIELTGTIEITGATSSYAYNAITATVDLTSEIIVTGATSNYNYQAVSASIDLTPEITVTGDTANYSYTAQNGVVELGAVINVVGATSNYSYAAIDAIITLAGEIVVNANTATYSYNGIRGVVQIGEETFNVNFNGYVKKSEFSGIIKQSAFFGNKKSMSLSGTRKQSQFSGVIK